MVKQAAAYAGSYFYTCIVESKFFDILENTAANPYPQNAGKKIFQFAGFAPDNHFINNPFCKLRRNRGIH